MSSRSISKGAQIAIGGAAVAVLLGWYGVSQLGQTSFSYYQTLDEFRAAEGQMLGKSARIHGYVATNSIERDIAAKQVRFAVQNDPPHKMTETASADVTMPGFASEPLPILFRSLETPDLFKDGAEVVVEGRLEHRGQGTVFVADNVLAKCPSKFEPKAGIAEAGPKPTSGEDRAG